MVFMVTDRKTIRLLILEDSQNEAERIVSLFRNAGHATRVHRITSLDDLNDALKNIWDLCIAAHHSKNLAPLSALQTIQRTARDISFIQLIEDNSADLRTEMLELGVQDAVPRNEDELLVLVAKRELANLEERRERRSAEVALREAEKRCQLLLDSSVDAIAYVHDGMHVYANRTYLQLFGYADHDEMEGMPMIDLIAAQDQASFKDFLKHYRSEEGNADLTCTGVTATNDNFKASISFSPAHYDGEPCVQVVIRVAHDNAELEEKLREISSQDIVTGLYNRQHFLELLDNAAERAVKVGQPSSVAYIKVDHYPTLQSDLGIAGIDLLLADLANILRQQLSQGSQIARFADDVFTVLTQNITPEQSQDELLALMKKVETQLFDINGRTAQTSLTIGVAGLNEKTSKATDVLKRAHDCADEAKAINTLKIYNPADEIAAAASRGDVIAMLQQALENNSFKLLFQPIISLRGDKDELYEVLLRLTSPQGEEVPPSDFINAAIAAGFAEKIDRWVLLNSIKLLTEHRSKGHQTRFFIHLSSASIQDPSLLPWLSVALKASRLPADSIILQIRETDAVAYLSQAKQLAKGLHDLHCQVALGQFGCTLNPFNTLKHLDIDFVKIDGSFTKELSVPENQEALKETLAALHAQAKQSIVPFVESASVLSVLWQAGVNYIQGHYLQGPSQAMNYDFSSGDE
mgnify:CR=1 FL=1